MVAMTKRNLKLYFSNKMSVFFSMLGALIAFGLYIIFLQKKYAGFLVWNPTFGRSFR